MKAGLDEELRDLCQKWRDTFELIQYDQIGCLCMAVIDYIATNTDDYVEGLQLTGAEQAIYKLLVDDAARFLKHCEIVEI